MSLHRRRFVVFLTTTVAVFVTSVRAWGQTRFGRPTRFGRATRFGGVTDSTRLSSRQFRGSGRVASLEDQLKAGLKARRQVEFDFIENAVKLVETKRLPVQVVQEAFDYARKRRTRHPFQYFQRVLALRAARLGVKISLV